MIAHTQEREDPRRVRSPPDGEAVVAGRRATSGWSAELELLFLILCRVPRGVRRSSHTRTHAEHTHTFPHAFVVQCPLSSLCSRSQSLPSPRISPAHLSLSNPITRHRALSSCNAWIVVLSKISIHLCRCCVPCRRSIAHSLPCERSRPLLCCIPHMRLQDNISSHLSSLFFFVVSLSPLPPCRYRPAARMLLSALHPFPQSHLSVRIPPARGQSFPRSLNAVPTHAHTRTHKHNTRIPQA